MHEQRDPQSGVNTMLIVLLIIIILGLFIWFLGGFDGLRNNDQGGNGDVNIELGMPDDGNGGDTNGQ